MREHAAELTKINAALQKEVADRKRAEQTRNAPERFDSLERWEYVPLYAATAIAREIETRWQRRKAMLSGLT